MTSVESPFTLYKYEQNPMSTVAVIDYGMGNLHSVAKALEHASESLQTGTDISVTHDHDKILSADHVVLPGVGAMRDCMGEINRLGIDKIVREVISAGTPFLGVCVGMQALLENSDENGGTPCLGIFSGQVHDFANRFSKESIHELKIPHMGWNQVKQQIDHPMWYKIPDYERFYFVHSYYTEPDNKQFISATCEYGFEFCVSLAKDNIFATQFHPEKSQHAGLQLYANFLNWNGIL